MTHDYRPLTIIESVCENSKHRDDANIGFSNWHIYRSVTMIYNLVIHRNKVYSYSGSVGPVGLYFVHTRVLTSP
jgi:hypothetical protein